MKTTITLPDSYHKQLKQLATKRSTTMTKLVWEALKQTFFPPQIKTTKQDSPPFKRMKGIFSDMSASEEDIQELKKTWSRDLRL